MAHKKRNGLLFCEYGFNTEYFLSIVKNWSSVSMTLTGDILSVGRMDGRSDGRMEGQRRLSKSLFGYGTLKITRLNSR